jgi:hypothetical protein
MRKKSRYFSARKTAIAFSIPLFSSSSSAWGTLARLGLARAYTMQGDTAKARTAYRDFLSLWKDADPDIPILKQAEAEYAKLN